MTSIFDIRIRTKVECPFMLGLNNSTGSSCEDWIGKGRLFPGIKDNLANLALIKLFIAFSCFSKINNFIDEASSFADTSENVLSLDF